MARKCFLALLAGFLLMGCSKHHETATSNNAAVTNASESPSAAAPGSANSTGVAGATPTNSAPDLSELSRELRRWIVGHRRLPTNFEEFAKSPGVQVPPPPPGKKYSFSKSTVILVEQ